MTSDLIVGLAGAAISGVLAILSLKSWRSGIRKSKDAERYEFENRSDGGVVGFESYEAANRHNRRKVIGELQTQIGCLLTPVLVLIFAWCLFGLALSLGVLVL